MTLARWMAQTLGQLDGRGWRLSHPLVRSYQLAASVAHQRQIWFKRLATPPASFLESPCCRAPFLPLLTREIVDSGLVCMHCGEIMVPFGELAPELQGVLQPWSIRYAEVHGVAHWDEARRRTVPSYEDAMDDAADEAEMLLSKAGRILVPQLCETYPTVIWEDQDECLSVLPEEVSCT